MQTHLDASGFDTMMFSSCGSSMIVPAATNSHGSSACTDLTLGSGFSGGASGSPSHPGSTSMPAATHLHQALGQCSSRVHLRGHRFHSVSIHTTDRPRLTPTCSELTHFNWLTRDVRASCKGPHGRMAFSIDAGAHQLRTASVTWDRLNQGHDGTCVNPMTSHAVACSMRPCARHRRHAMPCLPMPLAYATSVTYLCWSTT
jgi:hypothetical protein